MELEFVKVNVPNKLPQKTLRKDIFEYYFETKGYTRKDFTSKLGLNHRIFTVGLRAYYTAEKIEELRTRKIVSSNIGKRVRKWEDKLNDIEVFSPGFKEIFKNNVKNNPEKVMQALIELNDKFYKAKIAMRPIKKYANQSLSRLGKDRMRLVANGLEAKFKFILDELGFKYTCQFSIGKYSYDFKVNNILFEIDGRYHEDTLEYDKKKEDKAIAKGYKLIRFTEEELKKEPLRIRKCLKKLL